MTKFTLDARRDRRAACEVGRRARLEMVFQQRRGRTVLAHAYAEPPFRIGRSFAVDDALYVIVVCAGPGIFAGDNLQQTVTVERGASVLLTSQAALQLHPGDAAEPARVHHRYRVESGAELHCHWDPLIPFADARVAQRFDLDLAGDSRLYWSDALMSGRCSRGESWRFRALEHELRLTVDGSLEYLERYRLGQTSCLANDANPVVSAPPGAEGPDYLGTSLIYHAAATPDIVGRLHELLRGIDRVQAGVDLVDAGLVIARLLSRSGASFASARTALREAVLETLFDNSKLVVRR